ncbi:hypothetical protein, partial [Pseudomonas aeruginosa]|uniref:hypothetical protein n=1 Tax=Pseudomonas aeruginosa TaxID=287 RepID=UPI001F09E2EF
TTPPTDGVLRRVVVRAQQRAYLFTTHTAVLFWWLSQRLLDPLTRLHTLERQHRQELLFLLAAETFVGKKGTAGFMKLLVDPPQRPALRRSDLVLFVAA